MSAKKAGASVPSYDPAKRARELREKRKAAPRQERGTITGGLPGYRYVTLDKNAENGQIIAKMVGLGYEPANPEAFCVGHLTGVLYMIPEVSFQEVRTEKAAKRAKVANVKGLETNSNR